MGQIVVVTGSTFNDAPALEKASVSIAFGNRSVIANDSADMVLLNDDFSNIVGGIEEGRLVFENLRKIVIYTLATSIAEIVPFIFYVAFQLPLPLTSIMILLNNVITDICPAITLAYEAPELDHMERKPRNLEKETLITRKSIIFSYLQIGIIEAYAGMFAYFSTMSDYGFKPMNLFFLNYEYGCLAKQPGRFYDWVGVADQTTDIRTFFMNCTSGNATVASKLLDPTYFVSIGNTLNTVSPVTNSVVRYTSEALKYAQTSYWCAIVVCQWANLLVCKARRINLGEQGGLGKSILALIVESGLVAILVYVPFFNTLFGTRQLDARHFGVNAFPFFVLIFVYDEIRKCLMNALSKFEKKQRPEFSWLYKNTFA